MSQFDFRGFFYVEKIPVSEKRMVGCKEDLLRTYQVIKPNQGMINQKKQDLQKKSGSYHTICC
jgi:hypothetical protein